MTEDHNRIHERIDKVREDIKDMEVNVGRHEEQLLILKEQAQDFRKGFRAIESKVTKNTVITGIVYAVGIAVLSALVKGIF